MQGGTNDFYLWFDSSTQKDRTWRGRIGPDAMPLQFWDGKVVPTDDQMDQTRSYTAAGTLETGSGFTADGFVRFVLDKAKLGLGTGDRRLAARGQRPQPTLHAHQQHPHRGGRLLRLQAGRQRLLREGRHRDPADGRAPAGWRPGGDAGAGTGCRRSTLDGCGQHRPLRRCAGSACAAAVAGRRATSPAREALSRKEKGRSGRCGLFRVQMLR